MKSQTNINALSIYLAQPHKKYSVISVYKKVHVFPSGLKSKRSPTADTIMKKCNQTIHD